MIMVQQLSVQLVSQWEGWLDSCSFQTHILGWQYWL
jgi:hypothetical protein